MVEIIKYVGFPDGHFKFSIQTWLLILFWLSLPLTAKTYSYYSYIQRVYKKRKRIELSYDINEVVIVVLGDLGHSPRMSYHAKSFKDLGYHVNLCGYLESSLPQFLYDPDNIEIYDIPVIKRKRYLPYLIFAFLKVINQIFYLTNLLKNIIGDNTRFVLIQNPPSLPILLIIGLIKKIWAPNVQIIIDWHNLNWSILNLKYQNENHPIIKLMKFYEKYCSLKFADFNITVTKALKNYLIEEFGLNSDKIMTVYDRPSHIFQPLSSQNELKKILTNNESLFSKDVNYNQLNDRILITSTSFTPDEDFIILVKCLKLMNEKLSGTNNRIIMIVTGKGPLQETFLKSINSYKWTNIVIKNVWLPISEYPNILKIADLGISLHVSSSGLDLPMKIVDLFGSGVPVVSMNYPVIKELVNDDENGVILKDNKDEISMSDDILGLLFNKEEKDKYVNIKNGALLESQRRWDDEWNTKLFSMLSLNNSNKI